MTGRCGAQLELGPAEYAQCEIAASRGWPLSGVHQGQDHRAFVGGEFVEWPCCSQYCLKDHEHGRYRLKLGTPTGPASAAARAPKAKREKRKGEPRCEVCLQPGELEGGRCADRVACLERAPELELGI